LSSGDFANTIAPLLAYSVPAVSVIIRADISAQGFQLSATAYVPLRNCRASDLAVREVAMKPVFTLWT
jgi:hypothetical protein